MLQKNIIPTAMYPLNGNYKVFTYQNTEEVKDERILEIFDRHQYKVGQCYSNTALLSNELLKEGYLVKTYVGWLFVTDGILPVHHCWTVLNNKYLLDPSDQFTMMLNNNFQNTEENDKAIVRISEFIKITKNKPNSLICYPVGKPYHNLLYIGSECSPDIGKKSIRIL